VKLFRLKKEVANYLSVEIIGTSKQAVIEQFASWALAKCKRSGATWAADELAEVIERCDISEIEPSMMVDFEPVFVSVDPKDVDRVFKNHEYGAGYFKSMYETPPIDAGLAEAALLQAGKDPGDYGYTPLAEIMAEENAAADAEELEADEKTTKFLQDMEFADLMAGDVKVHNTQREADGTFRRFIVTGGGVEVTLNSDFPFEHIATLGKMLDEVAEANMNAGKEAALRTMRDALGVK